MTKVIRLGQAESPKELKPIEFEKYIDYNGTCNGPATAPNDWKRIEIICESYNNSGNALMYAYNDDRRKGALYLGKLNDGIV